MSNRLFCLMLDTTTTRAEIGRSWAAISQEIDVEEAQKLDRQNIQLRKQFTLLRSYPRLLLEEFSCTFVSQISEDISCQIPKLLMQPLYCYCVPHISPLLLLVCLTLEQLYQGCRSVSFSCSHNPWSPIYTKQVFSFE